MTASVQNPSAPLREQLDALRVELADLAFDLDRRGRHDAADLAAGIAARLRELAEAETPAAVD